MDHADATVQGIFMGRHDQPGHPDHLAGGLGNRGRPAAPGRLAAGPEGLPLLLPLRGVIKRDLYTLQWSSMVILIYFVEGVVRAWSDAANSRA
jgi:hypothetical protein